MVLNKWGASGGPLNGQESVLIITLSFLYEKGMWGFFVIEYISSTNEWLL